MCIRDSFNAMVTKISVIQNPGFLPDHPQNLITCRLCHARHTVKISERSVHNFLSYLADTQTNKQTKTGKNITSLAEVIIILGMLSQKRITDVRLTKLTNNSRCYSCVSHYKRLLTFKTIIPWKISKGVYTIHRINFEANTPKNRQNFLADIRGDVEYYNFAFVVYLK